MYIIGTYIIVIAMYFYILNPVYTAYSCYIGTLILYYLYTYAVTPVYLSGPSDKFLRLVGVCHL